ncbi:MULTISPECIES: GNAT family N-acetyltransferase [unclassified Serratia (in: enterobacteria)]|uniref:GNAT family N-acetyltransferase n=1 Tax=unclassified Serratia (in: enterobacteria) TaxID=2647522 RepID=UPI00046A26A1|nr:MULTISPECIES: GNAT family N-acetyltransferase [unclassified Serratia (in: enterobacteria)]
MKIVLINAATLPIYRAELARLLTDAVTHGASVGYDTQIPHEDAESYFHSLRPALAKGELLLWIARDDSGVIGTVQLALCQKPNGRNRAEVQKLLVHSRARRNGVGQALMKTLEKTALEIHRGLLYLDTQAGSGAEALYRLLGYRCLGEIPDYAAAPDGCYHPTAIYYKRLFAVHQPCRAAAS